MRSYILAALLSSTLAWGTVVYSNAAAGNDRNISDVFSDNIGITQIGDQITLAAGPRILNYAQVMLESFNDPVVADVTLQLFSVQGSGLTISPGSLLGSMSLTAISFPSNTRTILTFSGWNLTLPDDVIWFVSLANATSGQLGVNSFSPPTVGSSAPDYVFWGNGTSTFRTSFGGGTDDYYFVLDASDPPTPTPEPAALWGVGAALLGFSALRFRQ